MRSALSQCRSMRTASVLTPRSVSQVSNGPGTEPTAFWVNVELLGQLVVAGHERAADDVGVPAEVLGRRVQHDVRAQRERLLQVGRGEGVVDDEPGARLARDVGDRGDVRDAQQRVGRRLAPDDAGGRPDRRAQGVEVAEVDGGVLDAPRREDLVDQPVRAAVGVVRDDDVVAGAQEHPQQHVARRPCPSRTRGRAGRPPAPPDTPAARCGWGCALRAYS